MKPSSKVENFGVLMTIILLIAIFIGVCTDGLIRSAASLTAFLALSEICMTVIINAELNHTTTTKKDLKNTATIFVFKIGSFMIAGTMIALVFLFSLVLFEIYKFIMSIIPFILPTVAISAVIIIYVKANKKVMNHIFETHKK